MARRIAPVRAVLVASPDYLARAWRARRTPDDLAAHECLIYTGRTEADWRFRSGKRWISVRPAGRLRSDSGEALLQWAIAGLGIAAAADLHGVGRDPERRARAAAARLPDARVRASTSCVRPARTSRARCAC